MKQIILPLLSVFTIAMADSNSGNGNSDIFQCGDEIYSNYASYKPMPMIGTPEVLYEADCHYVEGKAYISFYTNVPRQLLRDYFQIGYVSTCSNTNQPFYSCNMSTAKPEGCDAVPSGMSFVVNQSLHLEKYETNDFFNKIIDGYDPSDFEIALPRNVSESQILGIGNDAVKLMGDFLYIYYGNDFVFGGDDDVVDFGKSLESALAVCKSAGEYYEKNNTLVGFKMSSSSSVASSSSVVESSSSIASSSSVVESSSAVMPKSSAVESSSSVVKISSSSVKSSSSAETICSAHPMRHAPSQPKSACITKNNKCYKCNGARGSAECSAEWLWTSPRDHFDSYWYSEVSCETAQPVLAKKGAADQNIPGIANGSLKNTGYAVDFSTDKHYFDALGRSAKVMSLKRRPMYVDKPSVKSVETQIPATED